MKNWLKSLRLDMSLTQERMAVKSNISQQCYSAIENETRKPSVDTAKAIAKILGFDWTKFFE